MWTFKNIRAAPFENFSKNVDYSLWGKHCIFLKLHFFGILFTLSILPLIITYYFTSKCKLITVYFFSTWTSWDFDFTEHNASLRPFFHSSLNFCLCNFPVFLRPEKFLLSLLDCQCPYLLFTISTQFHFVLKKLLI